VALRDDTFYGNIVAEVNGRTLQIDSRPSDALAVAVRTHVPVYVARSVMDSAGIVPEEDLQEENAPKAITAKESEVEGGEERLSVFQDFLEKLDLNSLDTKGNEEDNEED